MAKQRTRTKTRQRTNSNKSNTSTKASLNEVSVSKTFSGAMSEGLNALGGLGFLSSGKGMFSGMKLGGLNIGDKAIVTGSPVKNMPGHAPAADFAQLSDGSKLKLTGPNKGLIFR